MLLLMLVFLGLCIQLFSFNLSVVNHSNEDDKALFILLLYYMFIAYQPQCIKKLKSSIDDSLIFIFFDTPLLVIFAFI